MRYGPLTDFPRESADPPDYRTNEDSDDPLWISDPPQIPIAMIYVQTPDGWHPVDIGEQTS